MAYIKKYLHHIFVDGINGMSVGIFATYVLGNILLQLGPYMPYPIRSLFSVFGELLCVLTCAGIGIGIAYKFKGDFWISLSAAVCGMIGGYATDILAGTFSSGNTVLLDSPGEPLGAFAAACIGIEIGQLLAGKTDFDCILTPTLTIGSGSLAGLFLAPYISKFLTWFEEILSLSSQQNPFLMGMFLAVLMAAASTLPLHTVVLSYHLHLTGLAASAAAVGCCCSMIGFAVISYRENGISGFLAQGFGTSTLQMANVLRKPILLLPILLSSAILGPVSTILLEMTNTPAGAGLGTLGLGSLISAWRHMSLTTDPILTLFKIVLLYLLLPAGLSLFFSEWMRKRNWIKAGDLKLDF